jgi:uncharacterized protein YicC (UPF0701 family)
MTEDHKQALAVGRAEGRMVRAYLEALESSKPKRGRKRTKESIARRLEKIEIEIEEADPLKRLQLAQEKLDLDEELEQMDSGVDLTRLETDFTKVARGYAERKGITYAAFRQIGVPAAVLKKAGISRAA